MGTLRMARNAWKDTREDTGVFELMRDDAPTFRRRFVQAT